MNYMCNETSVIIEDVKADFFFTIRQKENGANFHIMPHIHAIGEVIVVPGEARVYTEKKIYNIAKQSICYIPPRFVHTIENSSGEKVMSIFLNVNRAQQSAMAGKSKDTGYSEIYSAVDDIVILENCQQIIGYIKDFMTDDKYPVVEKDNLSLQMFFLSLTKELSRYGTEKGKGNEKKYVFRQEDHILEHYIMENYIRKFSIDNVAQYVGYSPTYTARKIKKNYKMTYSELIMKLKMSYARRELIMTDKPFYEIAMGVGYDSYNGFGLAFKKFFKKTPEQMRKEETDIN